MKVQFAVLALAVAVASSSCSSNTGSPGPGSGGKQGSGGASGTGGSNGSGGTGTGGSNGSGGTGGGASCPNGTACAGSVVGVWTVKSSCLTLDGSVDPTWAGLDKNACDSAKFTGSLTVSGTFTLKADTTYMDRTTTVIAAKLELSKGCHELSGTKVGCVDIARGIDGATCNDSADGGCSCTINVNQMGGVGLIARAPSTNDSYTVDNNVVSLSTDTGNEKYASCVSGSQMTWTPQSSTLPLKGTIVFSSDSGSGSGGATGSGGMNGTGGGATGGAGGRGMTGSGGGGGRNGSTGGATGTGGGSAGGGTGKEGPCDIYAAAGQKCGAAYSTIRSLTKAYSGPLYQVRNMSSAMMNTGMGGMTKDIPQTPDGFADTSVQDPFCMGTVCTVSILYDQSGNGNDMKNGPKGGTYGPNNDYESSATKGMLMVGGHKVYSLYMAIHEGYRTPLNFMAKGVSLGNTAQGIYMLADGTHAGKDCCWDFGSVSPDPNKYVTMNTLNLGTTNWGNGVPPAPWYGGDFEGGIWEGGSKVGDPGWGGLNDAHPQNPKSPSMKVPFAMGVLHTPVGKYALRMADIQTATDLATAYDGNIPAGKTWGNAGGVVLGVGGDNSNSSYGTFYEGAMTNGSPSYDTDLAVMKNIQAVGYGK